MTDERKGLVNLSWSSLFGKNRYCNVHPDSSMGDPNYADRVGFEFVAFQPVTNLMIYKRKSWWKKIWKL